MWRILWQKFLVSLATPYQNIKLISVRKGSEDVTVRILAGLF